MNAMGETPPALARRAIGARDRPAAVSIPNQSFRSQTNQGIGPMRFRWFILILVGVVGLATASSATGADWRRFRGPAFGIAEGAKAPVTWDAADGASKNIAWRADLPGRGPSSPIVVKDRVVVTASDGVNQDRLFVLCFDAPTGKELWRRSFWATGRTACHPTSANAAPTPVSDGERIFAFYSSNDLIALDLDGNLLWYRGLTHDFPKAGNDVGMSSSPAVLEGVVVVQIENQGDSFAAGIEGATGRTLWRIERAPQAAWTSPAVLESPPGGTPTVLLQSANGVTAHEIHTGTELWRIERACDLIPSPILQARRAFFVASDRLVAVDVGAEGKSAGPIWDSTRLRPGAASPMLVGERLYTVNRAGVLNCADAKTGELRWQFRLKGEFWSSPVIADQTMYLFNSDGEGLVVKLGDDAAELLATNRLGEHIQASPAFSENSIFLRSDQHLWRIAESAAAPTN